MKIYNYDAITKEFISESEAFVNPRNKNNPIIPANATTIEPPVHKDGFTVCFTGNTWDYREDHRGEVYYNVDTKSIENISFIGELTPNFVTLDSPIANPPEEPYYVFNDKLNKWVGDINLYKEYIKTYMDQMWEQKLNTPYEFENFSYLPSWRELYTSMFVSLTNGLKNNYIIKDAKGQTLEVNLKSFTPIIRKMGEIVDEMYLDKHNLEEYFATSNDFNKLKNKVDTWLTKEYK